MRTLRALGLVSIALGACRSSSASGDPASDAAVPSDAAEASVAVTRSEPLVTSPVVAARTDDGIVVAARERGGLRWRVERFGAAPGPSQRPALDSTVEAVGVSTDAQLLASKRIVALGGATTDGGRGRRFVALDAKLEPAGEPFSAGDGACATADGVATISRSAEGWDVRFAADAVHSAAIAGPGAGASAEATLACGDHRLFVVPSGEGARRAVAWTPGADAGAGSAELPPGVGDDGTAIATDGETLVAAKIGATGVVELLSWSGEAAAPAWFATKLREGSEATLESIDARRGVVGLVTTRELPAKGCPGGGDATDTVAEVSLVERASGEVVRAPERIETWRCGADAGPFWIGWAADRFVVVWPRGADAACARAGLRWGGVGFAAVERASGHVRAGRAGRAADAIAFAGCDDARCWLAALTRGDQACAAADAPRAGTIDLVAIP